MRLVLRRAARLLTYAGLLVLMLGASAAGLLWLTLPRGSQEAAIPGLSAPVSITVDADGIPRIAAETELDAAAALGFMHARDRMFQLDLMRRAASGRLSEIAGASTLPMDRMMRTLGLRVRAMADLAALPADTQALLDAYARGVNAWIGARGRFSAPEFLVLGAPEPWQPLDSLLWGKTMGLWLSMNYRTELSRLSLIGKNISPEKIQQLWPASRTVPSPSAWLAPSMRDADNATSAVRALIGQLPRFPEPFTFPSTASNEWAVDGRHTASGAPLLAGDPHLSLGFPGIWYLARLTWPGHVLAGATAPGVPFLVLGHNGHIAWTFTTTDADVQDVFIETPAGPGQYQTPEGPRPFSMREERIRVRGGDDTVLSVRETRHGPVISDLSDPSGPILAVSMGNLQPDDTAASGLLALNHATSVAEAGQAAARISAPVQNLLVADSKDIGVFVTGRIPIRKSGDGSAPVSGADGTSDWVGWASGDALPHTVSPASGRLVNANEPIQPPDFPVFMGRDAFGDWRAQRIRAMLAQTDRHTANDFARMQADVQSAFAVSVLPALRQAQTNSELGRPALDLLQQWDGRMASELPQPLIMNAWIDRLYRDRLTGAGIDPRNGGPVDDFVAFVLSPAGRSWCGGDCGSALTKSLDAAMEELAARYGRDLSRWRWGDAHQATFAHPILRALPVLGPLTTARIATPGDGSTVDRGGLGPDFQNVHGASFRGVYDLSDLNSSLFMMAPGQSGNVLSSNAHDMLPRWRDGASIRLGAEAPRILATLRLVP